MAYRDLVCRLSVLMIVATFISYAQASIQSTNGIYTVTSENFKAWTDAIINGKDKFPPGTILLFDCDGTLVHWRDALTTEYAIGANEQRLVDEWISEVFEKRTNDIIIKLGYVFTAQDIDEKTSEIATTIGKVEAKPEDIKQWLKHWFEEWIWSKSQTIISEDMKKFVLKVQGEGYKTLVLTAASNTQQGSRTYMDLRKDELKMFNFAGTWKGLSPYTWTDVDQKTLTNPGVFPCYEDGIVMTGTNTKSQILKRFLEYAKYYPENIIFIDDKESYLNDVWEMAKSLNINFFGGLFLEADQKKSGMPLSKERAIYQMNYLLDNDVWLNDEEAEVHMAAEGLYKTLVERYGIQNEMPQGLAEKVCDLCKQHGMTFDGKMNELSNIIDNLGNPEANFQQSEEWWSILRTRLHEVMQSTYQKCRDLYRGEPEEPIDIDQFSNELCMKAISLTEKFAKAKSIIETLFSFSMDLYPTESEGESSDSDQTSFNSIDTLSQNGDL